MVGLAIRRGVRRCHADLNISKITKILMYLQLINHNDCPALFHCKNSSPLEPLGVLAVMMGKSRIVLTALLLCCAIPLICVGQCTPDVTVCGSDIPHLIRFVGQVKNAFGPSHTGVVSLRFTIYDSEKGGTALWQEVQNTQADLTGRYEVLLGATSTEGVPLSIFSNGGQRWLGVEALRPGSEEEQRVALVSVPYAVKAGDAQ